ncbi:hypothetical protein SNEBB_010675 [Seison nebaliae]|nr:hypothetical protein SNEBB_010675 [Seison nebaliae]
MIRRKLSSLEFYILLIIFFYFILLHYKYLNKLERSDEPKNKKIFALRTTSRDQPFFHKEHEFQKKEIDLATKFKGEQLKFQFNQQDDPKSLVEYDRSMLGNYESELFKTDSSVLGQNGVAVDDRLVVDQNEKGTLQRKYGFNIALSNKIPLNRSIIDNRHYTCKYWHYPPVEQLPTASIIIVFYNEGLSVVLRTIHSALQTSPPALIKDVVLFDDHSDEEYITNGDLQKYLNTHFDNKVIFHRNHERLGLIKARIEASKLSKGDVIVVLDAHCECTKNWLPPLLARIAENRKVLAIPIVDSINYNDFAYHPYYASHNVGIWEWGFLYKETELSKEKIEKLSQHTAPYPSPTHAGGLLAIDRKWFEEIGYYDEGIRVWGGEQYELSFKVWMCGGRVEWIPCSRIGHIYRGPRSRHSESVGNSLPHQLERNHLRVANVWMGESIKYFYRRFPWFKKLSIGDISKQLEVKERLKCKSFDWFMEEIGNIVLNSFPYPAPVLRWGTLVNYDTKKCVQPYRSYGQPVNLRSCTPSMDQNLFMVLNTRGELSQSENCIVANDEQVINSFCIKGKLWSTIGDWKWISNSSEDFDIQVQKSDGKSGIDNFDYPSNNIGKMMNNGKCLADVNGKLKLVNCAESSNKILWFWSAQYL